MPDVPPPSATGDPAPRPRRRGRVLIIDDEPSIGMSVRRLLASAHDVRPTTSVDEAMELIRAGERFDVILCDVLMPGKTGIDFYTQVAAELPDLCPRIALITGGIFSREHQRLLSAIPGPRLEKPLLPEKLRALVLRFLTD